MTVMQLTSYRFDQTAQRARAEISGETLRCELQTDLHAEAGGPCVQECAFLGREFPGLRFGFAEPWRWLLDLNAYQTPAGVMTTSQGFLAKSIPGVRHLPFARTVRCFWNKPEMLYERTESFHLDGTCGTTIFPPREYTMAGVPEDWFVMDLKLERVMLRHEGAIVEWQFRPRPVSVRYVPPHKGLGLLFDVGTVEALVTWRQDDGSLRTVTSGTNNVATPTGGKLGPRFVSLARELAEIRLSTPTGARTLKTAEKHDAVGPDERIVLPEGEVMLPDCDRAGATARPVSGLRELAVRRIQDGTVAAGVASVFTLDRLVESPSMPFFRPFLIRALRSLTDRRVCNVVPEDDPRELCGWGSGTWTRCFTITALDDFGLHEEAWGFLRFMLDSSAQFRWQDGLAHTWESFYVTGEHRWQTYDINGHGMKLYEAGKFYLRHRRDDYGRRLREEHYETLREWCLWIERFLDERGLILDQTESSWGFGYGVFSQAPATAGIELFSRVAAEAGKTDDHTRFHDLAKRLRDAMNRHLYGDAENPLLKLPAGLGDCYITNIPAAGKDRVCERMGLSCYSLAPGHYLADPEVGLMAPDDPKIVQTLEMVKQHGGCSFDPRIVTWHRCHCAHLGYGQGQILLNLAYVGDGKEFRRRLEALFDVCAEDIGDPYLMIETLGRHGVPNRGNKAHLAYFPVVAALLAGFAPEGGPRRDLVPDLAVRIEGNVT